jgi:hypothetical protein
MAWLRRHLEKQILYFLLAEAKLSEILFILSKISSAPQRLCGIKLLLLFVPGTPGGGLAYNFKLECWNTGILENCLTILVCRRPRLHKYGRGRPYAVFDPTLPVILLSTILIFKLPVSLVPGQGVSAGQVCD